MNHRYMCKHYIQYQPGTTLYSGCVLNTHVLHVNEHSAHVSFVFRACFMSHFNYIWGGGGGYPRAPPSVCNPACANQFLGAWIIYVDMHEQ